MFRFPSVILVLFLLLAAVSHESYSQTRIDRSVIASGAQRAGNNTHQITATVGQAIIGTAKSTAHNGSFGFWYTRNNVSVNVERMHEPVASSVLLEQNYPNPASRSTTFRFSIPHAGHVRLMLSDASGRTLRELTDENLDAGVYHSTVNVSDLATGAYFIRMHFGDKTFTKSITVVRR